MPIAAVAAGAFAVGEIATVGIAAMSAFEVIAAVGAITSGIGALTGNEDLMKIGAIAGIAGGVGAFAQGKGWLATGDAAKTAADTSLSTTKALTQTAAPGVETAASGAFDSAAFEGLAQDTAGLQSAGAVDGSIASNITNPNPLTQEMGAGPGLMDAANPALNAKDALLARGNEVGQGIDTLTKGSGVLDTFKGFGKFMKENKELASMGSNFIGGMFDDEKKAKTDYYQAQADATRAKTANGSAVPKLDFRLKQKGPLFKPTSPTYNGVRPSGLFYAK